MKQHEQILVALAAAPSHQLNVRTIARKLGIKPIEAWALCVELRRAGKIERAHKMHESPTDSTWRLV